MSIVSATQHYNSNDDDNNNNNNNHNSSSSSDPSFSSCEELQSCHFSFSAYDPSGYEHDQRALDQLFYNTFDEVEGNASDDNDDDNSSSTLSRCSSYCPSEQPQAMTTHPSSAHLSFTDSGVSATSYPFYSTLEPSSFSQYQQDGAGFFLKPLPRDSPSPARPAARFIATTLATTTASSYSMENKTAMAGPSFPFNDDASKHHHQHQQQPFDAKRTAAILLHSGEESDSESCFYGDNDAASHQRRPVVLPHQASTSVKQQQHHLQSVVAPTSSSSESASPAMSMSAPSSTSSVSTTPAYPLLHQPSSAPVGSDSLLRNSEYTTVMQLVEEEYCDLTDLKSHNQPQAVEKVFDLIAMSSRPVQQQFEDGAFELQRVLIKHLYPRHAHGSRVAWASDLKKRRKTLQTRLRQRRSRLRNNGDFLTTVPLASDLAKKYDATLTRHVFPLFNSGSSDAPATK